MELAIMEKEKKNYGICSTCNHLQDCLHRLTNGHVIWFCEQFDDYVPPKPRKHASINPSYKLEEDEGYMGLCVNCELRAECIHSKTPGGIWYCEEYC